VRAAVSVLAHKAAINGYKSAEIEVRVAPGPSWSSVLPKEQSVALFKEAMSLLLQHGLRVEELAESLSMMIRFRMDGSGLAESLSLSSARQ
jgi:hypothetical protein